LTVLQKPLSYSNLPTIKLLNGPSGNRPPGLYRPFEPPTPTVKHQTKQLWQIKVVQVISQTTKIKLTSTKTTLKGTCATYVHQKRH